MFYLASNVKFFDVKFSTSNHKHMLKFSIVPKSMKETLPSPLPRSRKIYLGLNQLGLYNQQIFTSIRFYYATFLRWEMLEVCSKLSIITEKSNIYLVFQKSLDIFSKYIAYKNREPFTNLTKMLKNCLPESSSNT